MAGFSGPMPGPGFKQQVAKWAEQPLTYQQSGQFTANKVIVFGSPRRAGHISDAYLALGNGGQDNSGNNLGIELDVTIDGTSVFTTKPKILHVTGEATGVSKSTMASGGGITIGVMDGDNAEYDAGDIIMGQVTITRTASPATEMQNVAAVVILNPN